MTRLRMMMLFKLEKLIIFLVSAGETRLYSLRPWRKDRL